MMGRVTIGIDIGQKHDPTAIAVVEAEQRADAWHFVGRLLERLALGTSYPEVAKRGGRGGRWCRRQSRRLARPVC